MLTREEHLKKCAEILEASADRATTSELLTQLSDHNGELAAKFELATGESDSLKERNARLLEQNTALFLRVGNAPEASEESTEEIKLPTFESLFDEKGRLK